MASFEQTSRDQVERLAHLVRRALRHTGLAVVIVGIGAVLSLAFALSRAHGYQSETTLLYRQLIPESVLEGRDVARGARELAARYQEMAISRDTLRTIVEELDLHADIVERHGMAFAVEEMRDRVDFSDRGAGAFRISYIGDTPEEAQQVTQRLAQELTDKDDELRRQQVEVTNEFLEAEKEAADRILAEREQALAEFLAENPEFAEETGPGMAQGAWTRALRARLGDTPIASDPQLAALQRQRERIQARLDEPDAERERERRRAERRVDAAEAGVHSAQRELETMMGRYTERHPDVMAAKLELASAQRRLREAEAMLPAGPAEGHELAALHRELQEVERQIATRRAAMRASREGSVGPPEEAHWVVALETEFARLLRDVEEAKERVDGLEHRLFTAQIRASSEIAASSQLVVIDEAFEPARPVGRSRRVIAAAGTMVFGGLAVGLLFALALMDDRIYGRAELGRLGIGHVSVVVPDEKSDKRANS
jgi:uncharacterized protein involved in exopolysaccharide biosynthesis